MKSNDQKTLIAVTAVAVILISGAVLILSLGNRDERSMAPVTTSEGFRKEMAQEKTEVAEVEEPQASDEAVEETSVEVTQDRHDHNHDAHDNDEERKMTSAEMQPREFFVRDFRHPELYEDILEQYAVDNLRLTRNGFELPPVQAGDEGKPRVGILESPPHRMDFSSNAVSALWKEQLEGDSDIIVELAVSPNGEDWSNWYVAEPDYHSVGNIRETYPDGSPNPNYGFIPSGVMDWGVNTWDYFRYRVTLYAEGDGSPALEAFRLYYQDSTLGNGQPVEVSNLEEFNGEPLYD